MAIKTPRAAITLAAVILFSLTASTRGFAGQSNSCDLASRKGPVSLLILPNNARVRSYAATVKDSPIVSHSATTVVFGDGRVVTSDVTKASRHINDLGWETRPISVVASFNKRMRRPPGGFG